MKKKSKVTGKYKKGICPKCGMKLYYDTGEPSDSMFVYNVGCGGELGKPGCGWTGREWYALNFIELIQKGEW